MEPQKPVPASSQTSQAVSKTTSHELSRTVETENNETAVSVMTTKARAEVESSLIMARKFPRNEDDIRTKVLKTCSIPSFAEKAKYKKPQGKTKNDKTGQWDQNYVIGPSVRLAEELFRQWGNIICEDSILFEDSSRRIVGIRAMDLQTLATRTAQFIVDKSIERKNAFGREVISERLNTASERVFLVVATEDEVLSKQNNIGSKYRRNLIIQLIPTYILQDSIETIDAVIKSGIKENPEKAKNNVMDNFARIGILPSEIEKYLGHPMAQILPDEIAELKDIFTAIIEKETTWAEVIEERLKPEQQKSPEVAPAEMKAPEKEKTAEEIWDETPGGAKEFKAGDPGTHQSVTKPVK